MVVSYEFKVATSELVTILAIFRLIETMGFSNRTEFNNKESNKTASGPCTSCCRDSNRSLFYKKKTFQVFLIGCKLSLNFSRLLLSLTLSRE